MPFAVDLATVVAIVVGPESLSVKVAVVVPADPSVTETSPIETDGTDGGGGSEGGAGELLETVTVLDAAAILVPAAL